MAAAEMGKYEAEYLEAYSNSLKLWPTEYLSYFVQTSYGKTHIIESGEKGSPPLVLLHGASMSSTMWYPNVLEWSKKFRVFAIDIIGDKNRSISEGAFTDREKYAMWLKEVFDQLEIDKAHIVGLSYGALNTVNFLMFAPERVNKAVLLSPAETFVRFDPTFYSYAFGMVQSREGVEQFLQWVFNDRYTIHSYIKEQLVAGMMWMNKNRTTSPENGFLHVFTDEELASIQVPICLLLGENEVMYNSNDAFSRAVSSVKHISVEIVKGVGHLMSMENPQYINERVLQFLDSSR